MPVITVIFFFTFLLLLLLLSKKIQQKKKIEAAKAYGLSVYDIELPTAIWGAGNKKAGIASLSDAEAFFLLVTPYLGSLSKARRDYLYQQLNDLKDALKMHKDIYHAFAEEYKIYADLNEEEAAAKWSSADS